MLVFIIENIELIKALSASAIGIFLGVSIGLYFVGIIEKHKKLTK